PSFAPPPGPTPGTPAADRRWLGLRLDQLALLVVVLAAALPFLITLTFGYTYDDVGVIADDPTRHTLRALWQTWAQSYWGNRETGLYRPLAQFLFALFWNVGGGHPMIFHIFVLAIHVATTVMLWLLLERALPRPAAILGATLFGVDPVHVEAIASIANSTEIMVTLLALAMVFAIWRATDRDRDRAALRWGSAILVAFIYLLALGAKESAGALPALALLCWWGWREPQAREGSSEPPVPRFVATLLRGWRVWLATAVALALAVWARYLVLGRLAVNMDFVAPGIRQATMMQRIWTMTHAWPLVGKLLFWPNRLIMHYGNDIVVPQHRITTAAALSIAVVALATLGAALLARRGDRRPLVAIGWIALSYFPASNILVPTGQLLAERTLYLPTVGAAMLVAWGIERLMAAASRPLPAFRAQLAVAAPVALIAVLGAREASNGVIPWQDSYTLFVSGINTTPTSARPYWLLGNWYINKGDKQRGIAYLAHAHKLDPTDPVIVFYYTSALHQAGLYEPELGVLRDATRRIPDSGPIRVMFLSAYGERRGADSLIALLDTVPPGWTTPYWRARFLGEAYARKGMGDSACAVFRATLAKEPKNGKLHYAFAQTLLEMHAYDEADRELSLSQGDDDVTISARLWLRSQILLARGDTARAAAIVAATRRSAPADSGVIKVAAEFDSIVTGLKRPDPPPAPGAPAPSFTRAR
ncbi:MAG: glycosyltransferase family 39 protein, partial [Gemmatimonadaceae bacterium]|nr:glycosyltransferase family 39 protein [Gemmatimonadaceae bacterium]